jgi:hypothetical protein
MWPAIETLLRSLTPVESERLFLLCVEVFLTGVEATLLRTGAQPPA